MLHRNNRLRECVLAMLLTIGLGISAFAQDKYLEFQGVKYRTGGANRAFIGSIGLKRNEGANTFYVMYRPKWDELPVERTGAFFRNTKGGFNVSIQGDSEPQSVVTVSGKVSASGTNEMSATFTIYQISDIRGMVDQLNDEANEVVRRYMMQSKDFRIITGMVVVTGHKEYKKHDGSIVLSGGGDGGDDSLLRIVASRNQEALMTINDNMIYAYEYGRLIWAKSKDTFFGHEVGRVVDIQVDRPGSFFNWGDAKALFINGTDDPIEPLKYLRDPEREMQKGAGK